MRSWKEEPKDKKTDRIRIRGMFHVFQGRSLLFRQSSTKLS